MTNLNKDNTRRREIAKHYLQNIKNPVVKLPYYSGKKDHVFHLFVVRVKQREDFTKHLLENGVQTMIHYPVPPHQQKALQEFKHISFPITESIHKEVVSLPISPVMSFKEADQVISAVNSFK